MASSEASRHPSVRNWYQRKTIWCLLLLLMYTLLGFFALPNVIEKQLVTNLKNLAQWETSVEAIHFNPFTFSLRIDGLDIRDKEDRQLVSWQQAFADFDALASLGGTITFSNIQLDTPYVYLALDERGTTNFEKAFSNDPAEASPEDETSDPLKLRFGYIGIAAGKVDLSDLSQGEEFTLQLSPLGLELQEFSTFDNQGGQYELALELGQAQRLEWKGNIGISPFESSGTLVLNNIQPQTYWHYAKRHAPYWLHRASTDVSLNYQSSAAGEDFMFELTQGNIVVHDLSLGIEKPKTGEQTAPIQAIEVAEINISPVTFSLQNQSLGLGNILVDTPEISLLRDQQGLINLLAPFEADTSASDTPVAAKETNEAPTTQTGDKTSTESSFRWNIDRIALNKGVLKWRDEQLSMPASLTINNIDFALGKLSEDLSQASPFGLHFALEDSHHELAGTFTPDPLALEGQLNINSLPLKMGQAYLSEYTNLVLNSGLSSLKADFSLALAGEMRGEISAQGDITELALSDAAQARGFSGIQRLSVGPTKISLSPLVVDITEVSLLQPYGEVFINPQGQLNLASLVKHNTSEAAPQDAAPDKQESNRHTSPHITIGKVLLQKGRFDFADSSQVPPFKSRISQLNGELNSLSSDPSQKSTLTLSGKIDDFGQLDVNGTLNPLASIAHSDIGVQVKNINLSSVSTYTSRYLGYPIDKGKLNLDMNYLIENQSLKADNKIVIDSLKLGKHTKSKDALSLPLPLALGILKNTRGVIDINLPVKGDLSDPGFSLGNIIFTAFTNLLTKAVTSPFSLLASIVEGAEDISSVRFEPGSSQIGAEQARKLQKLVEALSARPNLNLEIRGLADRTVDTPALLLKRLDEALQSQGGDKRASRERLLASWFSTDEVATARSAFPQRDTNDQPYLDHLDALLLSKIELKDVDYLTLAKERASAIASSINEIGEISSERIYVLEAQVSQSDKNAGFIEIPFSLNVR